MLCRAYFFFLLIFGCFLSLYFVREIVPFICDFLFLLPGYVLFFSGRELRSLSYVCCVFIYILAVPFICDFCIRYEGTWCFRLFFVNRKFVATNSRNMLVSSICVWYSCLCCVNREDIVRWIRIVCFRSLCVLDLVVLLWFCRISSCLVSVLSYVRMLDMIKFWCTCI